MDGAPGRRIERWMASASPRLDGVELPVAPGGIDDGLDGAGTV